MSDWWKDLEGPRKYGMQQKLMVTVCAWCGCTLSSSWTWNGGTSHGICPECAEKVKRQFHDGKVMA